jgi:hypothetical protein
MKLLQRKAVKSHQIERHGKVDTTMLQPSCDDARRNCANERHDVIESPEKVGPEDTHTHTLGHRAAWLGFGYDAFCKTCRLMGKGACDLRRRE